MSYGSWSVHSRERYLNVSLKIDHRQLIKHTEDERSRPRGQEDMKTHSVRKPIPSFKNFELWDNKQHIKLKSGMK